MNDSLFYAISLIFLSISNSCAQHVLWGVGSGDRSSIRYAEFRDSIHQSTSLYGTSDTAWTAVSISQDTGKVTPGNAYWGRTTGASRGAYSTATLGQLDLSLVHSQHNGVALFDSDFMDNGGVSGDSAIGTGLVPAKQVGALISPRINLNGYRDSALVVKFNTSIRNFDTNCKVSFSIDNGQTYTDVALATELPLMPNYSAETRLTIPFHQILKGVPTNSLGACRLKFTFDGGYYYWIIDDISIEIAPKYDFAIIGNYSSDEWMNNSFVPHAKIRNLLYIPFYCTTINPNNKEWFWGIGVTNKGSEAIIPSQLSPRIRISVDYYRYGYQPRWFRGVYADTIVVSDTLLSSQGNELYLTKNFRNLDTFINNDRGKYRVKYWIEHQGTDDDYQNDTFSYDLFQGDWNNNTVFSKGLLNQNNNPFASGTLYDLPIKKRKSIEYGSVFYFSEGSYRNMGIDSISFRVYLDPKYKGDSSASFIAKVYQWEDSPTGIGHDGKIDAAGTELTLIATDTLFFENIYSRMMGVYETIRATNLRKVTNGARFYEDLDDEGFYLVTLYQGADLSTANHYTDQNSLFLGVNFQNYELNERQTSGANPIATSAIIKVVDTIGVGGWERPDYLKQRVPAMILHAKIKRCTLNPYLNIPPEETTTVSTSSFEANVYPNPVEKELQIEIIAKEPEQVVDYIITDVTGRVMDYWTGNWQEGQQWTTKNVETLSPNLYYITIKTAVAEYTLSFIKQ